MITKRIIPCLDVRNGRVVKGTNFQGLRDVNNPVELGKFYSDCGADELVFYDITASAEGRALFTDILTEVARTIFIPLTVGGGINTLEDFHNYANKEALDQDICQVKGQNSGIMLKYLYMLAGDSNIIKPDRHMVRFINKEFPALTMDPHDHKKINDIIEKASTALSAKYPNLTPRFLDYLIWEYMK